MSIPLLISLWIYHQDLRIYRRIYRKEMCETVILSGIRSLSFLNRPWQERVLLASDVFHSEGSRQTNPRHKEILRYVNLRTST